MMPFTSSVGALVSQPTSYVPCEGAPAIKRSDLLNKAQKYTSCFPNNRQRTRRCYCYIDIRVHFRKPTQLQLTVMMVGYGDGKRWAYLTTAGRWCPVGANTRHNTGPQQWCCMHLTEPQVRHESRTASSEVLDRRHILTQETQYFGHAPFAIPIFSPSVHKEVVTVILK
jgi:hypothetical protein